MTSAFVLVDPHSSADLATQLVRTLPTDVVRIGLLGERGPAAEVFRASSHAVHRLPFRHAIDLGGLKQIRKAIAESKASVLHAVGPLAVRLSRGIPGPRLVVSAANVGSGLLRWLTERQTRIAQRVLAHSQREAEDYRRQGVAGDRILDIPPATSSAKDASEARDFRRSLDIPENARLIMTGGSLDRESGHRHAVWAFDGLKFGLTDLYLVIVGEGAERDRIEAFGKALGFDDYRIRYAGARTDLPGLLHQAAVVWVPQMRGGLSLTIDAMAVGRPVLACQGSEAAELLRDGETGRLVPKGDPIALGMKTQAILEDASLAERLGAASLAASKEYEPQRATDLLRQLYSSIREPEA